MLPWFKPGVLLVFGIKAALLCSPLLADELDNPEVPALPGSHTKPTPTVRVALVDSGVNYQLPEINKALLRDSTGQLVGYDFWDMDALPFDSHPNGRGGVQRHGTRTASLLVREAPFVDLLAYRYPRPDMQRMSDLIAHADEHDVAVIGLPLGGTQADQWDAFHIAAKAHPHILFVASAGNNGWDIDQQPVYPAALDLENMLVVTSADDFGRVAQGVNWGRVSVDYMVPAESQRVLGFDGDDITVAGSSYAVPRVVALAARYIQQQPTMDAADIIKAIRSQFANGAQPRRLSSGFLYDPRYSPAFDVSATSSTVYKSPALTQAHHQLPLQVLVLDERWTDEQVLNVMRRAQVILNQCDIRFTDAPIERVEGPSYLADLEPGYARTLMGNVRQSGSQRKLTVVFARDTLMSTQFDAEAFGRGNTRNRGWMTDSVWLTLALQDKPIALAHELFHVLVNSGQHSTQPGSLMQARTSAANIFLTPDECGMAVERARQLGLIKH